LDQIVWTTNPRNDTLGQLVGYIVEFAREYLANTDIKLHLELPREVPTREVSSEKRHHILQVAKEALNNVAKHSGARNVHLGISLQSDEFRIVIQDDGRGFDSAAISPHSNGLLNMRHRIAEIAGTLTIESQPDRGTTVTLSVKI
jgi:signal transduction histidine kinase